MRHALEVRVCPICGAGLEVGEVCNCDRRSVVLPKDGLRATCPFFGHRSSYRGRYYITCSLPCGKRQRQEYGTVGSRDEHYKIRCCWRMPCETRRLHDDKWGGSNNG